MNDDIQFAHKVRHVLNHGTDHMDRQLSDRLYAARRAALSHQRQPVALLSLAGIGHIASDFLLPNARALTMALALIVGAVGTYYWNDVDQDADDVDSALLADDLPINAYLDNGFQAWVDNSSQSSQ